MQDLKILNKKEIKKILLLIKQQWDCTVDLDYAFLKNKKNRLFVINKEISRIELEKLRINSLGLYFGEINTGKLRLSIEGSQIIGTNAKKNVLELNDKEIKEWLRGNDLDKETNLNGFIIIKNNNDFFGCGKVVGKKILNYVPKTRRVRIIG